MDGGLTQLTAVKSKRQEAAGSHKVPPVVKAEFTLYSQLFDTLHVTFWSHSPNVVFLRQLCSENFYFQSWNFNFTVRLEICDFSVHVGLILFLSFDAGHWLFSSNKWNIWWYIRLQRIYRALIGWRLHRWNANMCRPCGPSSGQITEVVGVKC